MLHVISTTTVNTDEKALQSQESDNPLQTVTNNSNNDSMLKQEKLALKNERCCEIRRECIVQLAETILLHKEFVKNFSKSENNAEEQDTLENEHFKKEIDVVFERIIDAIVKIGAVIEENEVALEKTRAKGSSSKHK